MTLVEALQDAIFSGLTDAECVAKFDETTEVARDNTAYTWSSINLKLLANGIDASLVATWDTAVPLLTGGTMLDRMLSNTGVDFTLDAVRTMVQAAIAQNQDANIDLVLNELLNIGITYGKRYLVYGLEALPTEAEVAAARVIIQNRANASALLNECINVLVSQDKSLDEIKAAVAAWSN